MIESSADLGEIFTKLIDEVFRANGAFLSAGNSLTSTAGITAAEWQILGAVNHAPATVSDLARRRGLRRQSVQQIANHLIDRGLLDRRENSTDRRAPTLHLTRDGQRALRTVEPLRRAWATHVAQGIDVQDLQTALGVLQTLRMASTAEENLGV